MKIRLLGALVGLLISFALPIFPQQKETVDPQTIEQLIAFGQKYDEAENNNDAAALAALLKEDAVFVTNTGPVYGDRPSRNGLQTTYRNGATATSSPRVIKILLALLVRLTI